MKTLRSLAYLALLSIFLAGPALAGVPGKTELTFSGSYSNPKKGHTSWEAGMDILFPLGLPQIVLGPSVAVADEDAQTAGGAVLEFNLPGQSGGFFFGAQALYFLEDQEGLDRWTASGRAGLKLPVSKCGLFKVYLEKPLAGRDRDSEDLSGVLAAVIKF